MARHRVNRSELGPMCAVGMIMGVVVAIVGISELITGDSYTGEPVMTIVGGVILLIVSIIARIYNSPWIDGNRKIASAVGATSAAAVRSSNQSLTLPQDPKFLAVFSRLPNCTDMEKLKKELLAADQMVKYGNDYSAFFRSNQSKEALVAVYQRYPHIAQNLAAQYYDNIVRIYGTFDVSTLSREEQRHRYVMNLSATDSEGDFVDFLFDLNCRGIGHAILRDPEMARKEFMNHPSKRFLLYLREHAPEGYERIISSYLGN